MSKTTAKIKTETEIRSLDNVSGSIKRNNIRNYKNLVPIKFSFAGRNFSTSAIKLSEIGKFFGLMFRTRKTDNLLFEFKNSRAFGIHSFFVFFSFLALWLDDKNNVISVNKVNPFTFLITAPPNSKKLLELPLNKKNSDITIFFVGKGKV